MRTRSVMARSVHLQVCDACGTCHEDLLGMLICQTDDRLDKVLSEVPSWDPEGSIEPLLDRHMPSRLRQRAWRRVRSAVIQRDCWTCQDCGRELKGLPSWYLEVHHIRPQGGEWQRPSPQPQDLVPGMPWPLHGLVGRGEGFGHGIGPFKTFVQKGVGVDGFRHGGEERWRRKCTRPGMISLLLSGT